MHSHVANQMMFYSKMFPPLFTRKRFLAGNPHMALKYVTDHLRAFLNLIISYALSCGQPNDVLFWNVSHKLHKEKVSRQYVSAHDAQCRLFY